MVAIQFVTQRSNPNEGEVMTIFSIGNHIWKENNMDKINEAIKEGNFIISDLKKWGTVFNQTEAREILQTLITIAEEYTKLRSELKAWHEAFGTSRLIHASERLRIAEEVVNHLEQENYVCKEKLEHEKRRADDLHGRRISELEQENKALKETMEIKFGMTLCPKCSRAKYVSHPICYECLEQENKKLKEELYRDCTKTCWELNEHALEQENKRLVGKLSQIGNVLAMKEIDDTRTSR